MKRTSGFDFDCVVIGGGPGGLVSTMYLRRFRREVAVVTSGQPRAALIPRTHNLIGFDNGITGAALLRRLDRHVKKLGAARFEGEAGVRSLASGGFTVAVGRDRLRARNVVFATGITDIDPAAEGLDRLRTKGLLRYCPICDAYEHRNRRIAVLANDTDGVRRGLFLAHYSKKLTIIVPERRLIAPRVRRLAECLGTVLLESQLDSVDIRRGNHLALHFSDTAQPLLCDVLYSELGSVVNDSAFAALGLRRNRAGRLVCRSNQLLSLPGAYAVGDCTDALSQLAVAAAQGATAATAIHASLRRTNDAYQLASWSGGRPLICTNSRYGCLRGTVSPRRP